MISRARALATVCGVVAMALLAVGCGDDGSGSGGGLTLYNAQHESLTTAWVEDFEDATGISVKVRSGDDFELANLLVQEGSASPADVFITENSPAMAVVDGAGLFAPVDAATLPAVPEAYRAADDAWVGIAARSTVLVYNPSKLPEADLPDSIMELSDPAWEGKLGMAPGGADFQAIVSAVLQLEGEQATADWLSGLAANANVYQGNTAVMKAVNDGEIAAGIIYHYYWFKDQAESGANSDNTELHFFTGGDPGAFVSVSGAGVLKSSGNPTDAQKLVAYLTSMRGQQLLADSDALEYPIDSGVAANPAVRPFSELQPPDVDIAELNGPDAIELIQQAGLL